jgi:hypothetical protein
MWSSRRDADYLQDIVEAMERILAYTAGVSQEQFLGEAVKRLLPSFKRMVLPRPSARQAGTWRSRGQSPRQACQRSDSRFKRARACKRRWTKLLRVRAGQSYNPQKALNSLPAPDHKLAQPPAFHRLTTSSCRPGRYRPHRLGLIRAMLWPAPAVGPCRPQVKAQRS